MSLVSRRRQDGFTMIEALVVIVIGILVTAIVTPFLFRTYKRQKLRSAVQEVYSIVLAGRMQAIRRNLPVVVFFDLTNHQILTWAEIPHAGVPVNYVQDVDEPTITQWNVPQFLLFTYAPGGGVNGTRGVAFDKYLNDATLVDRIIFQGDGSLVQPQAADSIRPSRPASYTATVKSGAIDCAGNLCRGVYLSDQDKTNEPDRDVFRISVDDFGSTGKVSLLKWLPQSYGGNGGEIDYVPGPWVWSN